MATTLDAYAMTEGGIATLARGLRAAWIAVRSAAVWWLLEQREYG